MAAPERELSFEKLLDVLAQREGEEMRVLIRRPGGSTPLAVFGGRLRPLAMSVEEDGGLAMVPLADDGYTALHLSPADFVSGSDHGALGLAAVFGDVEIQIDWVE